MSNGAKINALLLSLGASADFAYTEAHRLDIALQVNAKVRKVSKPATRKGTDGLMAGEPCSERILAYARSRKGNVFSLASLALSLGNDRNYISTNLTTLVKRGFLNRTGRGEYVLIKK